MKENANHAIFVKQMTYHGNKVRAYQEAYPGTTEESARVSATRLLQKPEMQEALKNVHADIHLGIKNDKQSFIFQEAKIINEQRQYLIGVINGGFCTVKERILAIQVDRQLAEQQMALLGYGSLKQAKQPYQFEGIGYVDQPAAQQEKNVTKQETVTISEELPQQTETEIISNSLTNNNIAENSNAQQHSEGVTNITPAGNPATWIPLAMADHKHAGNSIKKSRILKLPKHHQRQQLTGCGK